MPRLLHVLSEKGYSGGEVQLRLLLEHFQLAGFHNEVVLAPGAKFRAAAEELGIPVHEVPLATRALRPCAATARWPGGSPPTGARPVG